MATLPTTSRPTATAGEWARPAIRSPAGTPRRPATPARRSPAPVRAPGGDADENLARWQEPAVAQGVHSQIQLLPRRVRSAAQRGAWSALPSDLPGDRLAVLGVGPTRLPADGGQRQEAAWGRQRG